MTDDDCEAFEREIAAEIAAQPEIRKNATAVQRRS
jgi:hypothetical protein